jgi:hypothetical protein
MAFPVTETFPWLAFKNEIDVVFRVVILALDDIIFVVVIEFEAYKFPAIVNVAPTSVVLMPTPPDDV